jgi:excinuclease ABC subunit A
MTQLDGGLDSLIYLLDEPTVRLSFFDIVKLMELLERLVQEGNSVVIIEHDPKYYYIRII